MRLRRLAGPLTLVAALGAGPTAALIVAPAAAQDASGDAAASGIPALDARPSAEHAPDEVVRIVVAALQENDASADDAGIATVFAFASPGNRAATGPLTRFEMMIKRGYADMLSFRESRFGEMQREQDIAMQVVWLMQPDGRETGYVFQLGKQDGGEYDGMWLTDAVYPIGEGPRSGTRI